jgi:ferric-dicitrate binding protein FerR (iron transport regulator)
VLGTAFNVKAYPGDQSVETSLIRGSVQVMLKDRPDDVYILRPNEKLVISNRLPVAVQQQADKSGLLKDNSPLISLRNITVADSGKLIQETAWVQNKLVFRDETFASLALRMERWYDVKIHFQGAGVEDLSFTGIFTTETIGQALQAMQLVHPFVFKQENDHIYIQ